MQYSYDGNGSLIQATPGEEVGNGAKRYSYNTAGFLVKVETYSDEWQSQAEMAYDGLGNRLAMTGYADGQSVTTAYVLDGGQTLLATAGEMTTAYLYGMGVVGEKTDAWAHPLLDGANTARQMVNAEGEVTLTTSYTPWGDTLEVHGTGSFTSGYFGGIMDAATGLLYVGNGQYYNRATGRFLNRDTRSGQANPYVPWKSDPAGAMIAPLALLALLYGNKKKRGKWDNLIILLVLCGAVGMSLSACNPVLPQPSSQSPTAPTLPSSTSTPPPAETQPSSTPRPAASPTVTLELSFTVSCTATFSPTPTRTPIQMPDILNEALLRDRPEKNTYTHGKDYYAWYKQLWQNKNWWWWNNHTTFSAWDLFTLIIHIELDNIGDPTNQHMHAGYESYKEAVVRAAYGWCKNVQSALPDTPEGALNWIAAYSESGKSRVGGAIEQKPYPFDSAIGITTAMRDPGSDWAQGLWLNRPYGVGNKSLYPDLTYLDTAANLGLIVWRSGPETGNEVIIPNGCGAFLLDGDATNYTRNRCGTNGEWPLGKSNK